MVLSGLSSLARALLSRGQPRVCGPMEAGALICPKCGRPSWAPYRMRIVGKYGAVYEYEVFRHPDGRRRTPKKCTVRIEEGSSSHG